MDTSGLVAAIRIPTGASAELMRLAMRGRVKLLASVSLFMEYEAVATRDEHLAASGLSRTQVGAVLDALAQVIERVEIRYLWRPQLRDPDDERVLETAVNGGADAIVTFNARDFTGAARFGVQAITPGEALAQLGDR